jgi:hypothetical protein
VSASGIDKVYDGTTNDTVTLYANPIASDVVNQSYTAASFSTPDVGSNKAVSVVGITLTGVDASNYSYNTTASTTASITASGGETKPPVNSTGLIVVPTIPLGTSNQAPLALQKDMSSGVSIPTMIVSMTSRQSANQSNMLMVANPQRGPEMQSLFPAPVIAPMVPIVPILVPKQGRN